MTLRYTAITQETIVKEYYEALVQTESKYAIGLRIPQPGELEPGKMLSDIIRWLRKTGSQDPASKRTVRSLIKRIERIQAALEDLTRRSP